jgi:S1-C subfamily serine protease
MLRLIAVVLAQLAVGSLVLAESHKDIQDEVLHLTPTASYAVLPVTAWIDTSVPGQAGMVGAAVIGTAFVVNNQGYFVTAAHVASTTELGSGTNKVKVRLTVGLRQRKAGISDIAFEVVELDEAHDLALCHLQISRGMTFAETGVEKLVHPEQSGSLTASDISQPFASLAVAQGKLRAGRFVLISGFPLGSWVPAIQLGMLSATSTLYPNAPIARLPKDTGELLQVSVSGNHGDSGGPVIDLYTGEVVGVILSIVPAPLALGGQQLWSDRDFDMSGIMLAAPAKWIKQLLTKHGAKSESIREGKLFWGAKAN